MIIQPVFYKSIKFYNNIELINDNLWQKPTDQQKKLLLDKNFADEGSMTNFLIATFFTICLLGGFYVGVKNNTIDDIVSYIIIGLILLIPLWRMYFVIKNEEKILKDVITKDDFVVLDNIIVTDYILYHKRRSDYYCTGFLIEIAGEQYKINNFSGNTNYNKNNKELEYNKAMLVKVNIKSNFFEESDKLKLFFYD